MAACQLSSLSLDARVLCCCSRHLQFRTSPRVLVVETQESGMQTEPVMWDHWNPRNWHHILKDAGCYDLAIDTFMLMAQLPHDEARYWSNQIMSYLRSKHVRDASKLVHSWSIDARKKVLEKMEYQLYIDKRRW